MTLYVGRQKGHLAWFAGGDSSTGAVHVLQLQLSKWFSQDSVSAAKTIAEITNQVNAIKASAWAGMHSE